MPKAKLNQYSTQLKKVSAPILAVSHETDKFSLFFLSAAVISVCTVFATLQCLDMPLNSNEKADYFVLNSNAFRTKLSFSNLLSLLINSDRRWDHVW